MFGEEHLNYFNTLLENAQIEEMLSSESLLDEEFMKRSYFDLHSRITKFENEFPFFHNYRDLDQFKRLKLDVVFKVYLNFTILSFRAYKTVFKAHKPDHPAEQLYQKLADKKGKIMGEEFDTNNVQATLEILRLNSATLESVAETLDKTIDSLAYIEEAQI